MIRKKDLVLHTDIVGLGKTLLMGQNGVDQIVTAYGMKTLLLKIRGEMGNTGRSPLILLIFQVTAVNFQLLFGLFLKLSVLFQVFLNQKVLILAKPGLFLHGSKLGISA